MRLFLFFLAAASANAQLVSSIAIPKGPNLPVVFVNGYQADCRSSNFPNTFGVFDQVLQSQNRVSLFFDNCAFTTGAKPSIEELGNTFGLYLGSLKYTDGTVVPLVDVVAHSMGGLVVRSYLEGKQLDGTYNPPLTLPIRKIVFLATPNFGTPAALGFSFDKQLEELATGSVFVFDLNTWNQGIDDLRGLDVLAIAGNGGTGQAVLPRFDDGIVSLTSASIGFARPNRTRILPVCHTGPGLITLAALCPAGIAGIAEVKGPGDIPARIVTSFLGDGPDYNIFGQPASENEFLATSGGVELRAKAASGQYVPITKATASSGALKIRASAVAYSEYFPFFPTQTFTLTASGTDLTQTFRVNLGTVTTRVFKDGPQIARVLPSAANITPLAVGSNSYISIYGTNLDDAQVTTGSTVLQVLATSANQVNAILATDPATTVIPITVTTRTGADTINVFTPPNVPALFTQNSTGSGPASALNAVTNILVSPNTPLHGGDYVSLYLTGLSFGSVLRPNSTFADISVTVAGRACPIQFAGVAPGYTVLDQINCQIPGGISSTTAPVIVTVDGRASNTATLAVAP